MFHSPDRCAGEPCTLHNPSEHHMLAWTTVLRSDLSPPIIERICSHGVGHPDPDSAAWAERAVREDTAHRYQDEDSDGSYVWIHGCDGCCAGDAA